MVKKENNIHNVAIKVMTGGEKMSLFENSISKWHEYSNLDDKIYEAQRIGVEPIRPKKASVDSQTRPRKRQHLLQISWGLHQFFDGDRFQTGITIKLHILYNSPLIHV